MAKGSPVPTGAVRWMLIDQMSGACHPDYGKGLVNKKRKCACWKSMLAPCGRLHIDNCEWCSSGKKIKKWDWRCR